MTVDVMVPFYGDVALLQHAVRSVLAQRRTDWRLVVVDDRNPAEGTEQWLRSLRDPRVQYRRNDTNLGVNGNFRRCLELVESDVFTVLGCDDEMLPGHLEVVVAAFAAHPGAAVVQAGVEVIDQDGRVVRPLGDRVKTALAPRADGQVVLRGEQLAISLLRGNWTYFPSLAFRTEIAAAIGFRPGLDVVLDLALLLDIVVRGGSIVYDPSVTFRYRRHSGSVSSVRASDGRRFTEEREFFAREAAALRARGWHRAARAAGAHITSRMNAAATLPAAIAERKWQTAGALVRHAVG